MAKTQCFFLLMTDAIKTELMTLVRVTNQHTTGEVRILKSFFLSVGSGLLGCIVLCLDLLQLLKQCIREKTRFVQWACPRMDA